MIYLSLNIKHTPLLRYGCAIENNCHLFDNLANLLSGQGRGLFTPVNLNHKKSEHNTNGGVV
jgi:hypothetical protein